MRLAITLSALVACATPAMADTATVMNTTDSGHEPSAIGSGLPLESHNGLLVLPNVQVVTATTSPTVLPTPAAMLAQRDPATGRLRSPTPAELADQPALRQAPAGAQATVKVRPDGVLQATLGASQMSYLTATRLADGRLVEACSIGEAAAQKAVAAHPTAEAHHGH